MINAAHLWRLSDEEFLREFRTSDDPVIQEFYSRLTKKIDDIAVVESHFADIIRENDLEDTEGVKPLVEAQQAEIKNLEDQIDDRDSKIQHLETEQDMIEEKLDELIAAIKENTAALKATPQTAAPAKAESKKTAAKKTAPKAKASEPDTSTEDGDVSKTDVKNKLLDVQTKFNADTAKDIIRTHSENGKALMSDLAEDKFAAVIAACDDALKTAA